jgi:hypothetical protein
MPNNPIAVRYSKSSINPGIHACAVPLYSLFVYHTLNDGNILAYSELRKMRWHLFVNLCSF